MTEILVSPQLEERRRKLAHVLPLDFPISLNIESTNACNLDCFFCPRKESSKGVGLMDFALFSRIVDECAEYGPLKLINLHKDGEPLVHPRILDMVQYIADKKAAERFGFTSNGILLSMEKGQRLLDAGLNKISFSIDAVAEETYRKTKGKDKYAVVEQNVRDFLSIKPGYVEVAVKFIHMQENLGEKEAFIEKWRGAGVEIIINEYHDWSGGVRNSSLLSILPTSEFACENPFYASAINWNGTVSLCCVDWNSQAIIGDVHTQSLVEIWRGAQLRRIRDLHLRGKANCVSPCANCTYKKAENREHIGGWLMQNREQIMGY
ncbi:MAG: radical SAM protein [Deltaproteobacteria bacterium]|nr:radical SAM protein [Deltaproteobacteria bacterium]